MPILQFGLAIVLVPTILFQLYFLDKKAKYFGVWTSITWGYYVAYLILLLVSVFMCYAIWQLFVGDPNEPISEAKLLSEFTSLLSYFLISLAIASGLIVVLSKMIPEMANYNPAKVEIHKPSSGSSYIVDGIGLIASILGIISFIIDLFR